MSGTDIRALAGKGEGTLIRHASGVWSYPGAEIDRSGTNLVMPTEYVSDAEVQQALAGAGWQVTTRNVDNSPRSIRLLKEGAEARVMSVAAAGTPEAGTELPMNSRPTHDAGARLLSPQEAAETAERIASGKPAPAAAEGGETGPRPTDSVTGANADPKLTGRSRK